MKMIELNIILDIFSEPVPIPGGTGWGSCMEMKLIMSLETPSIQQGKWITIRISITKKIFFLESLQQMKKNYQEG